MPTEMTLEQAQEQIIELTEEVENIRQERDTLSQNNENLKAENENLRTLNQKYFNKLIAQDTADTHKEDKKDEEQPTCEQFAESIFDKF